MHTIQINKTPVTGTTQRLMVKTLAARAASGDVKAAQVLLPLIVEILGIEDRGGERQKLSAQDQAILDELLAPAGAEPNAIDPDDRLLADPAGPGHNDG